MFNALASSSRRLEMKFTELANLKWIKVKQARAYVRFDFINKKMEAANDNLGALLSALHRSGFRSFSFFLGLNC